MDFSRNKLVQKAEPKKQEDQRAFKSKLARGVRDMLLKHAVERRSVDRSIRFCDNCGSWPLLCGRRSGYGTMLASRRSQSAAGFELRHEERCFDQYSGFGSAATLN